MGPDPGGAAGGRGGVVAGRGHARYHHRVEPSVEADDQGVLLGGGAKLDPRTGEMRHHDVLAKVAAGASVVLTEHTNCERGWLGRLAGRMRDALGLDVRVSTRDHDPLRVR